MYQLEGKYPCRRSHLALQHLRLQDQDTYNSGGLLPTNGPEWHRIRSLAQKPLSPTSAVFSPDAVDVVAKDFVKMLQQKGQFASTALHFL